MQALHRVVISIVVLFASPRLASAQARDTGFELEPGTTVLPPIRFEQGLETRQESAVWRTRPLAPRLTF